MLLGILLVILIIIAFLFEWRTAFISLIAIPLSLVSALLVLDLAGSPSTSWSWRGWWSRSGWSWMTRSSTSRTSSDACDKRAPTAARSTFTIILEASVEVRSAITYATVINVVAVVPVLFLEGLSGSFFQPLVLSYALAVLVSMLVALTVTPALCLLLLSRGKLHAASRRCSGC